MKISFIGAGKVASNLGKLFTHSGHEVVFGSRNSANGTITIAEAIKFGEVIFLAVPYKAIESIALEHRELLRDKIIVDVSIPVNLADWSPLQLGDDSAGEQTAHLLPQSKVTKSFNHIFADQMSIEKLTSKGTRAANFVVTDNSEAGQKVKQLSDEAGFDTFVVNGIQNSRYLEALSHLNIAIALQGGGADAGFSYHQEKSISQEI